MQHIVVPEYQSANSMLNDIAVRAQQCFIGIEMHERALRKMDELLPDNVMIGSATSDGEMPWGQGKTAKDLLATQSRAKQFIVLSGINTAVLLIDDYMKAMLKKYWQVKPAPGDESWFSPEVFEMYSGVKLEDLRDAVTVEDFRRAAGRLRVFKNSRGIQVSDFFDMLVRVNNYMINIAELAVAKVIKDKTEAGEVKKIESVTSAPPESSVAPEPTLQDLEDLEERYGRKDSEDEEEGDEWDGNE